VSHDLELGGVLKVSPSRKNLFTISMKFGVYVEVDGMTICSMTRSKVKVKVTSN